MTIEPGIFNNTKAYYYLNYSMNILIQREAKKG